MALTTRTRSRTLRNQRGAAAVEMALIAPLLFLLVFGIVEFGFAFNRWLSVTHAAREGVRQYALGKPAADAEAAAEAAAPDLGNAVTCTASDPAVGRVAMRCETVYDLQLYVLDKPVTLTSTATMSRE